MDEGDLIRAPLPDPPYRLLRPRPARAPVVVASPHSGRVYPPEFLRQVALDPLSLRRSEDAFVDELFQDAPALGLGFIAALFPRVYVDVNREAYELDPEMFREPLPAYANPRTPRVVAGLGTIARVTAGSAAVYAGRLPVQEALRRIQRCYRPYHAALAGLVEWMRDRFGRVVLVDCHSMPAAARGAGAGGAPDVILGDGFATTCSAELIDLCEARLRAQGYRVGRNVPYAGGWTTRHYGRPRHGVEAIQIELARGLYMDEETIERGAGMTRVTDDMRNLLAEIAAHAAGGLRQAAE